MQYLVEANPRLSKEVHLVMPFSVVSLFCYGFFLSETYFEMKRT